MPRGPFDRRDGQMGLNKDNEGETIQQRSLMAVDNGEVATDGVHLPVGFDHAGVLIQLVRDHHDRARDKLCHEVKAGHFL